MRFPTQDPKYDIEVADGSAYLVNAETGEPIPKDEPVFMFRGKDARAVGTLYFYQSACEKAEHKEVVEMIIEDFEQFRKRRPELMKEPDTRGSIVKCARDTRR